MLYLDGAGCRGEAGTVLVGEGALQLLVRCLQEGAQPRQRRLVTLARDHVQKVVAVVVRKVANQRRLHVTHRVSLQFHVFVNKYSQLVERVSRCEFDTK